MYSLPLPETSVCRQQARLLLQQEICGLLLAPALWIMLIILSLLVGYSFIQAVNLFSQASQTALSFPEMAQGMNPLDGIFVPTFGAYYLAETLLLPFVAIRLIGTDKQSGALKLLLQLPFSPFALCGLKITAMGLVWLLSLVPAAMVLLQWHFLGGHIYFPEVALLLSGHALYSLTIIAIAMFAATISGSLPTAAMFCLSITLGSWVLDFAAAGREGMLAIIGRFSLAAMLHQFENGLLTTGYVASFVSIALVFFLLSVVWLHPGKRLQNKLAASLLVVAVIASVPALSTFLPGYRDLSENRRHSFNPADSHALAQLNKPLIITVHLNARDSRLLDLESDMLAKLRRIVPDLRIRYAADPSTGLFSAGGDDKYGLIEYEYDGHRDTSYSNSREEILSIIYKLAGITVVAEPVPTYPGYPLVADAGASRWLFYLVLPLLFLCGWLYSGKRL